MYLRAFAAATALLIPAPVAPATVAPMVVISPDAIPLVMCIAKDGIYAGSAFRVGNGLLLSVNHVTSSGNCFIGKTPVSVKYKASGQDFSMISGDAGPYLTIDCGGYVKGREYIALGHARGLPQITAVALEATGEKNGPLSILVGIFTVIPGQSGGPIIDAETGKVVGVVNTFEPEQGLSGSVQLKDTPVCKQGIA